MLLGVLLATPLLSKITYTLRFEDRVKHYVTVEIKIDGLRKQEYIDFKLPVWAPGSYKVRDFSGNVITFSASAGLRKLDVIKLNKNTWRVMVEQKRTIVVKYQVYAFVQSVRQSFVDADRALLNGASVFMYPDGMEDQESLVVVHLPRGWQQVTSSLPWVGGRSPVFRTPDYDTLADTPFMLGAHTVHEFSVDSIPFKYAISGKGSYNQQQLLADTETIGRAIHSIFGTIPYTDYTIFLELAEKRGGALEHLNSMHYIISRWTFEDGEHYQRFIETIAHEMFHAYNVKRIRPVELGPFDYNSENYTTLLWVAEGLTSYYDRHLLLRTGLMDIPEYFSKVGLEIDKMRNTPGRLVQTLQEASFDAWIKFYQPDENSANTTISYYTKGGLVGLALDLAIRSATAGRRSLDDVLRALWQYYENTGDGFTEEQFRIVCEDIAGQELENVFQYVNTTAEMDWNSILELAGLVPEYLYSSRNDSSKAYYGFEINTDGGRTIISRITHGSPVSESRLSVNDEIIFVDNFRVTAANSTALLGSRTKEKVATFVVNRGGVMRTFKVRPGTAPPDSVVIVKIPEPTESQRMVYQNWLGAAWD
ncbi:MAG: M61 family metallopeptidase [Candidatus Marinimicrobia bacterium]|nr:M61 family metallopeptidase [Candidatus Neomarinimicrobiota bacterium]